MNPRFMGLFLIIVQVTLVVGCGGGGPVKKAEGKVSGTLSAAGKPLGGVVVTFQDPVSGAAAAATTEPTGEFKFEGPLVVGTYKVFVTSPPLMSTGAPDGGAPPTVTPLTIPEKYKTLETTDLKAEVKEGNNDIPLDAV